MYVRISRSNVGRRHTRASARPSIKEHQLFELLSWQMFSNLERARNTCSAVSSLSCSRTSDFPPASDLPQYTFVRRRLDNICMYATERTSVQRCSLCHRFMQDAFALCQGRWMYTGSERTGVQMLA